MNITFPLLTPEQIEVKVKQVRDGNVALLLYKTARTDMDMLDKVVGPLCWETDYKEIKGNLYCGIGIYDESHDAWVWKWDCGTESRPDDEGNQKKGEASDAFKRAGFKWGIGRELYTGPHIVAYVPTEENRGKYVLKEKHHKYDGFVVGDIGYEDGKIIRLRIDDSRGNAVFTFPRSGSNRTPAPQPTTTTDTINNAKANNPLDIPPEQTRTPAAKPAKQMATDAQKATLRNMVNLEQLAACNAMYGEGWARMTANQCLTMISKISRGQEAAS